MTLTEFYQGKTILLTGATGFLGKCSRKNKMLFHANDSSSICHLGKVVLEKICHSLRVVKTIYISVPPQVSFVMTYN